MRSVSSAITTALNGQTFKASARLTLYKSRVYFSTYDDYSPVYALPEGSTSQPVSEAAVYIPAVGKILTISVDESNYLVAMWEAVSGVTRLEVDGNPLLTTPTCRIGAFLSPVNNDYVYIYYCNDSGDWYRLVISAGVLDDGESYVLEHVLFCADLGPGAMYPVSATEAVLFTIENGGMAVYYIDANMAYHRSPSRFMNPTVVLGVLETDVYLTHYAGAARLGDKVYAYYSCHNGSVQTIHYTLDESDCTGVWSDIQTAMPQDLSSFKVNSVFTINDRIFMCGRFDREEDFASGVCYTLLTWSQDGIVFTVDRRILCSAIDLRWLACSSDDQLAFSSQNRTYRESAPYQILDVLAEHNHLILLGMTGSVNGEFVCKCKAGDESYLDLSYLSPGTYSTVEIGIFTGSEYEFVKYFDTVVTGTEPKFRDGSRELNISVQPDGLWHPANLSHPFYMEFMGKQSIFDNLADFSNMYRATAAGGPAWSLSSDLWSSDGVCAGVQSHDASSTNDHWGVELDTTHDEFPVFGDAETYEVRVYGWSRAGKPDTNPNTPDDTPKTSRNDDFYALIEVEEDDGSLVTYTTSLTQLTSSHEHPPQTYFTNGIRAGSYPVTFALPNPGEGKKIHRLGVRVISHGGATVYLLERVEIPEVVCYPVVQNTETGSIDCVAPTQDGWNVLNSFDTFSDEQEYTSYSGNGYLRYDGEYSTNADQEDSDWAFRIGISLPDDSSYSKTVTVLVNISSICTGSISGHGEVNIVAGSDSYTWYPDDGEMQTLERSLSFTIAAGETKNILCLFRSYNENSGNTTEWTTIDCVITVNSSDIIGSVTIPSKVMISKRKGVPQLLFSSRPYSAYNFEATTRWSRKGSYVIAGIAGLATDDHNFLLGYFRNGYLGLARYSSGRRTVITEFAVDMTGIEVHDLRFWHRDGLFGVEYKSASGKIWPARGSQLLYEWTAEDGALANDETVFHVGAYSLIDPPKVRIIGHRSTQIFIGVMPLDWDPIKASAGIDEFASRGTLDIDGIFYTYTGKNDNLGSSPIMGPFDCRNNTTWNAPYNKEIGGDFVFQGGRAVEFTLFKWWAGSSHHDDFINALAVSDAGYSWRIQDSQWKPWITTEGKQVYLRNRSRHYSTEITDYWPSANERYYITTGFSGVKLSKRSKTDSEMTHAHGAWAFKDTKDEITLWGFTATSGDHDQSVRYLLKKLCQLAGTNAEFPGDYSSDTLVIASGSEEDISV